MSLPPLPPGFVLEEQPPKREDPWIVLQREGFVATNGFRTKGDVARIRSQGYTPAANGAHNRGDGVDLDHPRLTPEQQARRLRQLFGDWDGAVVLDEGHHRHLALPGWGAAPGTPGTPNSGLPELPPGFELEQRGSLKGGNFVQQEKADRIATLDQGLANGDMTPAEHKRWTQAVRDEPAPVIPSGGVVAFKDEQPEGPSRRFTPEQEAEFFALARDRRSTAADLVKYAADRGFTLSNAQDIIRARDAKGGGVADSIDYRLPQPVATNDGALGAATRGVADPFNVLDEMGAVADTIGVTPGRENVFNSDRSFGDILYSNIDANRAILKADERDHFAARFGGQLATNMLIPIGNKARTAAQLARVGAAEGAAAGFGAGEGNPLERLPNTAAGAAVGTAGGFTLGKLIEKAAPVVRRWFRPGNAAEPVAREAGYRAAPVLNDGVQQAGPTPGARTQPQGGVVGAELVSAAPRARDYIDVSTRPSLTDDPRLGRARPISEQPSPDDIAAAARSIYPEDVVPRPRNFVDEADEVPSSLAEIEAPRPGRRPKRPPTFLDALKGSLQEESARRGLPVRIDAEDAIDKGVPAEYIYSNPNVADRSKLRLRNPSIFGTRYGAMSGTQQQLRSLDMADADPAEWGFDAAVGGRLEPEDVGDLIRRSFEGDETALQRGSAYDKWAGYTERLGQRDEFNARFPEGAVEQRGEPVSMTDLDAMQPPATAYEDLPKVGGTVGNINLANVETRADIRRLLQNVETKFGGFDAARRGRITQAETEALARELGMTPDDLMSRRAGQALNAEQALAARQLLAKSADEVVALAQKLGRGASDEQKAVFARAIVRHAAIHEQVTGATAEAGRALAAFKLAARSKAVSGRIHETVIQGMGGGSKLEDIASGILDLQRKGAAPGQLNSFAVDAIKPGFRDKLVELWYNSLLSGPQTHAVNILSNSMTSVLQLPEQLLASGIGQVRRGARALTGKPDDFNRVTLSEVGPRLIGMMQGAREGLRAARHTLVTGEVPDFVTKVESRSQKAISGIKGEIIRTPSRLLAAEDEFFKAVARRMELSALAARQARREGLRGAEFRSRVQALVARPPDAMLARSLDYARYLTFQQPLGRLGQRAIATTQEHRWLKLFFPFVRTPTNLLKFAVERSPAAPALREVREAMREGGEKRALAISRMMLGTGLGMTVAQLAHDGLITGGGPADRGVLDMMRADGWQPYSLKIGDRYYSYQRLDPLATTLGVSADLVDYGRHMTEGQSEQATALVVVSILRNLGNKTWLSGMSDLIEVLDDPQRNGGRFVSRLAGSLAVPAGIAQAARTADPVQRETREGSFGATGAPLLDRALGGIQARIPGLSRLLPAKRDVFGDELRNEGGVGPDIMSPIWTKDAENDPIIAELVQLTAKIGRPSRKIQGRKLSPAEYERYQQLSGQYIRDDLTGLMSGSEWSGMNPEERIAAVDSIKRDARADARADLALDAPPLPPGFELVQ
jgi:hypothetical protein